MALLEFKNLPDTSTPLTAENLNNNFEYLDDKMSNFLKVETTEISLGSFTANQEKYDQEYSITIPTGYTPLGIMGYRLVGNSFTALRINGLYIGSNKIKYSIENTSGSSTGSITFTVYVAFIKSS